MGRLGSQPKGGSARPQRGPALTAAALAAAVLLGAGTASAYWSGAGTGAGTASSTTATAAVTLTPGKAADTLYPGAQGDVVVTATNPNTAAVVLTSLVLDIALGTGGLAVDPDHAKCPTSDFAYTTQTNNGAGYTVPGRSNGVDGVATLTLAGALSMSVSASDACQGAGVTVYLKVP